MIKIIAAVTADMGLGRHGELLYHISADLKHFKALTMGHPIVMGRNTFESFPNGPLPGRRNIVITTRSDYNVQGIEVYHTLSDALRATGTDCYVIGGGRVYRDAMPLAHELHITHIEAASPAGTDTYFPPIDHACWQVTERTPAEVDPRTGVRYSFVTYRRL